MVRSLSVVGVCVLALCSGACASSTKASESPWLDASPGLQERIDRKATSLAYTPGLEARVQLITWFARVGEPAYPTLLEMVDDPRPDVAGAALAALGATRDARLVPYLQEASAVESETVSLERGRALLMLGDWSGIPAMITGLRAKHEYTRAVCQRALSDVAHETFGYDPRGEASAREAAVLRWEAWWDSRTADPLLAAPTE
ncbi:MAG: HEAT repeat protein [Chlamydiales bacterium]